MTKNMLVLVMAAGLCGCAGVSITPVSTTKAGNAHIGESDIKGYIVYAPVTVVEVSDKVLCLKPAKDTCLEWKIICGVSAPFVLPDHSRPFVVEVKSGFGKAGADIGVKDGWLITHIKDASDNTALLGFIEKLVLADTKKGLQEEPTPKPKTENCTIAGLYQVLPTAAGLQLKDFKLYRKQQSQTSQSTTSSQGQDAPPAR